MVGDPVGGEEVRPKLVVVAFHAEDRRLSGHPEEGAWRRYQYQ